MRSTEFTKLNKTTERARNVIRSYDNSGMYQLWHAYPSHYSGAKARAYDECVELMKAVGGHDLKIIGAGSHFFSVGFIFVKDSKKCLAYITPTYNYAIELEDARPSDGMNDDEWFDDFKNRYDKLGDTTKKHLANACPHITSREQAEGIMRTSEIFDVLFKLEENDKKEGTN